MAVVALSNTNVTPSEEVILTTWTPLANGDTGAPVSRPDRDCYVQVAGTPGAGGTVVIQGSNDGGTTWSVLSDWQGNALSFTAAGIKTARDRALLIRPSVTAGDGTTAFQVRLIACRARF